MNEYKHVPVMLSEAIDLLGVSEGKTIVDVTLGGAGHFKEILNKLNNKGILIGLDKDSKSIENAKELFGNFKKVDGDFVKSDSSLTIILSNRNFSELEEVLKIHKIEKIDGVLADLGLATDQYKSGLGISYLEDAELDMRMEKGLTVKASDLLNGLYQNELEKLFFELGDIFFAKRLSKEIIQTRLESPINTTTKLREIIQKIVPFKSRTGTNKHPEAKVFQALRIAVNHELYNLKQLLPQAFEALAPGGRMVIISFHSGEDRIVKEFFNNLESTNKINYLTKLLKPSVTEIAHNSKSHSAKLRAISKI